MTGIRTGLLWTAALVASGIAFSAHAGVREGVEAWQRGEYDRAVSEWEPLAESGDADAQFNLGQAYKLGRGVPQDMERAEQLYGEAARQGHLQAQANYGLILFQNGDREEAMPWIIDAANRGEPRAQYIYGTALFNGDLVERDWVRGYAMMTRAAEAGLPQAQSSLGQMEQHLSEEERRDGSELARAIDTTRMAEAPPPPARAAPPPRDDPPAPPIRRVEPRAEAAPPPSPPAQPARSGAWRVQLGAFRDRGNATEAWESLSRRVSALADLQPFLVTAGPYTRLQAGPFPTQAEAERACRAVRGAGSDCITRRAG